VANPGPLAAQIEGAVVMGISTALREQARFGNGEVISANFDDYRIQKMSEIPEIEVHIVKSTDKIGGIGEPDVPPVAPAIANALFNGTGVRIRVSPLILKRSASPWEPELSVEGQEAHDENGAIRIRGSEPNGAKKGQ
jgi:isoquinoline 1-oxidoreductase beta subunit